MSCKYGLSYDLLHDNQPCVDITSSTKCSTKTYDFNRVDKEKTCHKLNVYLTDRFTNLAFGPVEEKIFTNAVDRIIRCTLDTIKKRMENEVKLLHEKKETERLQDPQRETIAVVDAYEKQILKLSDMMTVINNSRIQGPRQTSRQKRSQVITDFTVLVVSSKMNMDAFLECDKGFAIKNLEFEVVWKGDDSKFKY